MNNNGQKYVKSRKLEVASTGCFTISAILFGIFGIVDLDIAQEVIWFCIALAVITAMSGLITSIISLKSQDDTFIKSKQHILKIGTDEHTQFFVKKYSASGKLTLYVKTLHGWVNEAIFEELKKKSNDRENGGLVLYVEEKDDKANELEKNHNAKVVELNGSDTIRYTISLVEVDDSYTILVRDRDSGGGTTLIIEEILTSPSPKLLRELILGMISNHEKSETSKRKDKVNV